jgi:cell division protein FtsB
MEYGNICLRTRKKSFKEYKKRKKMQIDNKDGKIRFFFRKEAKTPEEEEAQKKAVLSAVEEIRKMKWIDLRLIIILCIFFSTAIVFHYYAQKVEKNPEYIEQIQAQNLEIEQNIEKQILDRKAEELGFQKLHKTNPDIVDYVNLYIAPKTALYELETEKPITYKGVAISVPAVKLREGKTVFTLKNVKYYIKD